MATTRLIWPRATPEAAWIERQLVALNALQGDLSEAQLRVLGGEPVTTARTRRLYRIPHPSAPETALFVKIQVAPQGALKAKKWISYAFQSSPLVREARALHALAALGFRTPEVLAFGGRGRFPGTVRAALITRAVPDVTDLEGWLKGRPESTLATSSVAAVQANLHALHARGLALGGAMFRDFLVPHGGAREAADVTLIDTAGFGSGTRRRACDLRQFKAEFARFEGLGLLPASSLASDYRR